MKKIFWMVGLCWMGAVLGCLDEAKSADRDPIFRHHFRGEEALAFEKGGTRSAEIWRLPETAELLEHALNRLATLPTRVWPERLSESGEEVAGLVSPLLRDLLQFESVSEIYGPTNRAETVLAVRLNGERASVWDTNLWQLVTRGTGASPRAVQVAEFGGWEASLGGEGVLQLLRTKGWLVLAVGRRPLEATARMLRVIDRQTGPSLKDPDAWFETDADLAALGFWLPLFRNVDWPRVSLATRGEGENLRTTGRVSFRNPIPWAFEPWRIPTNSIVEPVVSFTAGQGLAPLLKALFGADLPKLEKLPNQFCLWGQPTQQRQAVLALPVPDATNTIHRLAIGLPKLLTKILGHPPKEFLYLSNRTTLVWRALAPPAYPYMIPWDEAGQDYLLASLLPVPRETNPPPAELFGQLGERQDLVYYDWELTEERALFASQVYQLLNLSQERELLPLSSPPQKWLLTARPLLGNTITEITRTGPKELSLVRKSHLGLTGFELVTLVQWISSPGFPLTFELPPRIAPAPGGE